jgi:hypothetical protein
MVRLSRLLTFAFALLVLTGLALAAEEKTLKGTITCAKCDLKQQKTCATVITVKEGGKDVVYFLDAKSGKANHKAICMEGKPGTVTGEVSEKDGKKLITASKVEIKKD